MGSEEFVYIDGKYYSKADAKISVYDHGLLYGDGVFEGIRVYSSKILKLHAHVDRLYNSAKSIFMTIPVSKDEMCNIVKESCKKNNIDNGYVRLVVTRGIGDLGLDPRKCSQHSIICIAANIQLYPKEFYEKGLSIVTATQRRNKATIVDPQIKSLNYLNNILAKIEATRNGVNEAIMLNEDGIVAECTGDNIFIIKDNVIFTPPMHAGILNGITRQIVLELAQKNKMPLFEKIFTLFNLYNADECFLTGTAAEVVPVIKVDERVIGDGKPGPVTNKLLTLFRDYVTKQGVPVQ